MKLPIKTRILEYAIEKNEPFTSRQICEDLGKEYLGERTAKQKGIDKQLDMYCRVGFLETEDVALDGDEELVVSYKITDAGKKSEKYIPGHGNKYF